MAAELHGHRRTRAAGEQHWHRLVLLCRHPGGWASVRLPCHFSYLLPAKELPYYIPDAAQNWEAPCRYLVLQQVLGP